MAKEIPGFYYDEEKGKYFRIQQSHRVVKGTGYTKQSIKVAEQAKQSQEHIKEQTRRETAGKIVRSRVLIDGTSPLGSRLGFDARQNRNEVLKQYGIGLSQYHVYGRGPLYHDAEGFLGSSFSITRSGILRATCKGLGPRNMNKLPTEDISAWDTNRPVDHPSISLSNSYLYYGRVPEIITSVYNKSGEECAVLSSDGSSRLSINLVNSQGQMEPFYVQMNTVAWGAETIWDIASSPGTAIMAVATDAGLLIRQIEGISTSSPMVCPSLKREQMNVCFKEANIVMSGERSGRVNFTDTRSGQSVVRLLHSSAVLGTLALQHPNQVLVHGYSTTNVYDLRWVQQSPVRGKARFTDVKQHSVAFLKYAIPRGRSSDHYTRGHKIAYSSDLGLVAAVNSNTSQMRTSSFVTLYSARTGQAVRSPLTDHEHTDDVTCVDITRVRDGPESVFCLYGNNLDEWALGKVSPVEAAFYGMEYGRNGHLKHGPRPLTLSYQQEWDRGNGV